MKTILIVAAHPDDELLGAGATLRKHAKAGDAVFACILGQGAMSRTDGSSQEVDRLKNQANKAGRIIGFTDVRFSDFPDNAFDTVSLLAIAKAVEDAVKAVKPDIVYTHHGGDLNIDHRLTFQSVLTACRPCNDFAPREILTFETLSSTEWQSNENSAFRPNRFVDVESEMEDKLKALACYESEMRSYPHPRSPEGVKILAQYRGLESGLRLAEAFHLVRSIVR